jgi:hypothetical protein
MLGQETQQKPAAEPALPSVRQRAPSLSLIAAVGRARALDSDCCEKRFPFGLPLACNANARAFNED